MAPVCSDIAAQPVDTGNATTFTMDRGAQPYYTEFEQSLRGGGWVGGWVGGWGVIAL